MKSTFELLVVTALLAVTPAWAQSAAEQKVVDAINDGARSFYEHYGFQRFADHEYRLFLPMKTIQQLFEYR